MKNNKTEQRPLWKTALIFAAVLLICCAAGLVIGIAMAVLDVGAGSASFAQRAGTVMAWAAPALYLLIWVAAVILCVYYFIGAKRLFAAWDGESDGPVDRAEEKLCKYMIVTNCLYILSMLLFGVWAWASTAAEDSSPAALPFCVLFVVSIIAAMLMQRAAVELEKRINPEKRGEVLDFRFQKTWESSMDEGEKQILYKAGCKAFKGVRWLCLGLWLLCCVGELAFSMGVMPMLCVSLIWLVSTLLFQIEAFRLEHGGNKRPAVRAGQRTDT